MAERFAGGVATEADREWVVAMPEIAERMVDGSRTTMSVVEKPLANHPRIFSGARPSWEQCKSVDRYSNWYSVAPRKLVYRYHTRADFCYNGSRVTSVTSNYGYFTDIDLIYNVVKENAINSVNGSGSSRVVHTQGHIQACIAIKIGCALNYYPWGKVTLSGNGGNSLSWGE